MVNRETIKVFEFEFDNELQIVKLDAKIKCNLCKKNIERGTRMLRTDLNEAYNYYACKDCVKQINDLM